MKKSRGVSTFELSHLVIALAVWTAWAVPAGAVTYTWTNAAAGDWSTPGNWDPSGPPADGSDVVITNGSSVTLSANSFNLSSLTNSGTLTFVNWTTTLSATNVTVLSNGYVTCAGPFTNNAMSNRVYVLCSNLTVFLGGSLNVDAKGYAGGTSLVGAGNGQGPGGGQGAPSYTGGGGYGGRGGRSANVPDSGGASYDSPYTVEAPGSGGGGVESVSGSIGGAGGGAVRIIASGFVTNDGLISAEGQVGLGYGGGGSGGGIYVRCNTIGGSGRFRAGGKDGGPSNNGGGGAGGRVAWVVNPAAQGAQLHNFNFSMSIGRELPDGYLAEPGSLMVSMPQLLPTPLNGMNTYFYGTNDWAFSSLTMSNAWLGFSETNVRVTVSNDITVHGAPVYAGRLDLVSGVMFECRGNLILTNGGQLHVLAGATNASSPDYGALVSVSGAVTVANNCWIYPYSHNVNGATPLFRMSNLVVAAGGGIDANGLGYRGAGASGVGWGPGAGTGSGAACGAGHGGQGG